MEFIRVTAFVLPIFLAIYIGSKYRVSGTKLFFLMWLPSILFGIYVTISTIINDVFLGSVEFHFEMLGMILSYAFLGFLIMLPALFMYGAVLLALEKHFKLTGAKPFFLGALVGFFMSFWYGTFMINEFSNKLLSFTYVPTITGAFSIVILNYVNRKILGNKI